MKLSEILAPYEKEFQPDLVLSLPLPCRYLTGQQGVNRMAKSKASKDYRTTCMLETMALGFKPFKGKVRIHHIWVCGLTPYERACRTNKVKITKAKGSYRPQDEGNAVTAMKACIDGLVDAGLLRGDTRKDVSFGEFVKLSTAEEHHNFHGLVLMLKEIGD